MIDGVLFDVTFEVVEDRLFQVSGCFEVVQELSGGIHCRGTPFQLPRTLKHMCCGFDGAAHGTCGVMVVVQFVFVKVGGEPPMGELADKLPLVGGKTVHH